MTEFLIYQGKVAVALAVFYIFYRLLLSKESLHRLNRFVLLGTAALSFILPLCIITVNKTVILPSSETVDGAAQQVGSLTAGQHETIWAPVCLGVFILGALTVLIVTAISIFKVRSIIRSGEQRSLDSGETLVLTETPTASFSWMKYIVLSREDYEEGCTQILTHEKAHVALRHSWDLLFVNLVATLQWFNPVIWMLRSDLRDLHEFEADDAVLRSGANIKEYQYLLIKKAIGKSGYSVVDSFNHSTLKNRITMMSNKKSSRMSAWKALYLLPLAGISLAANAEIKVNYQYESRQSEAVADTFSGKDTNNFVLDDIEKKEPVPFHKLPHKPRFNGGDANEFSKWVAENLVYPEKCRHSKVQGSVILKFTIAETGKVSDITVLKGVNEELDKEAVRVVSESPLWTPGKDEKGEIVPVTFVFPVAFKLN